MDGFEELKELIFHYARGIWKNRWLAIAIAWLLLVIGLVFVDQLKDRYTAEAKVYIDTTSVLRPLLKGITVETDLESNVQLMVRKLLSRPNLERAIRLMDMDVALTSDLQLEQLVENLKRQVSITTKKKSNVYTISYQNEDPVKAKRMVQTFMDIFVEDTLGKSASESDSAIIFLDTQIKKYEELLQQAEHRLELFKRKNVGIMPQDGANYFKQLQQLTTQLEQAKLELSEANQRRDKLQSQIKKLFAGRSVKKNVSRYEERINKLEGELEDLLLIYTDAHPDVINKKRILQSLYDKKEKEAASPGLDTGAADNLDSPVYQELQVLLSETEANIASLSARVRNYQAKKNKLKKHIDVIPEVESDLKKLNRDYDVIKNNYTELVKRREQAKLLDQVETGTERVKFRIIEPPHVPKYASFPNRPLFDLAVLVASLGAGYGIGLLLSLIKPVFYNPKDLRTYTGLPVLGSVIKLDTDIVLSKRRHNITLFIVANLMLLMFAAVVVVLHMKHISIISMLQTKLSVIL